MSRIYTNSALRINSFFRTLSYYFFLGVLGFCLAISIFTAFGLLLWGSGFIGAIIILYNYYSSGPPIRRRVLMLRARENSNLPSWFRPSFHNVSLSIHHYSSHADPHIEEGYLFITHWESKWADIRGAPGTLTSLDRVGFISTPPVVVSTSDVTANRNSGGYSFWPDLYWVNKEGLVRALPGPVYSTNVEDLNFTKAWVDWGTNVINNIHPHVGPNGFPIPEDLATRRLSWYLDHDELHTKKNDLVAVNIARVFYKVDRLDGDQWYAGYRFYMLYGYSPPGGWPKELWGF